MTIDEYSQQALSTLMSEHGLKDIDATLVAQVFGLVEESSEVAGKFKKLIRDKQGRLDDESKKEILKELGDVLWYVTSVAHLLGADLATIAQNNLDKLSSRKERGVISGSGDNR